MFNFSLLAVCFLAINVVNPYLGGDPTRAGKMMIFFLGCLLLGSHQIYESLNKPLGLLIGYAALSWCFFGFKIYGTFLCVGSIAFLLLANYLVTECEEELFAMLRISMWIQLAVTLVELFGVTIFHQINVQGTMGHPLALSVVMAMLIPFCLERWSRVEAVLLVVSTLLIGSTTGIMAMVGSLLYYLYVEFPKRSLYLSVAVVAICGFGVYQFPNIEFFSLSGRALPWRAALDHLHGWRLIIGHGPGSWFGEYGCVLTTDHKNCSINHWGIPYRDVWDFLHSDPFQLVFELGLPALALGGAVVFGLLRDAPVWIGASMVAVLVDSLAAFPFHLPVSGFLFCVLVALTKKYGKMNYA